MVFDVEKMEFTKYIFFTGKGGVGKTSAACALAVYLADSGEKALLVSTDPASNLQDVFEMELSGAENKIPAVPNLFVANLDPVKSAAEYRESVVAPYRGILPQAAIESMEEQLSGACTVEIAAFNEFTSYLADEETARRFDHIIFDTAPTGHTLRMLQLPSAWTNFISESTHGASCLGQLSGLESRKGLYRKAMDTLKDKDNTTLFLVSTPERTPLIEAERASGELKQLGILNQVFLINGVLEARDSGDETEREFYGKQQLALKSMPVGLAGIPTYAIPLRSYNIKGIANVRRFFKTEEEYASKAVQKKENMPGLIAVIDDLYDMDKKVIFTMGKGGVGKTSVAAAIALGLAQKGKKVHLATTDPASNLKYVVQPGDSLAVSYIDEERELEVYKEEVLSKARENMSEDDIAYIEEDLRSPCTQEIAVFRAFARIVERSENEVVVIDTAPTGHTLLLLDATLSYHREVKRTQGEVEDSVKKLLPRLRNEAETQVVIVTLPEATPVFEAQRLDGDLKRAGIKSKWWVINRSLYARGTTSALLGARAANEMEWIKKMREISKGNIAVIPWIPEEVAGKNLGKLL